MNQSEATIRAEMLASALGSAWKPIVWENLGWHYAVQAGSIKLHPNHGPRGISYTAFIGDPTSPGGLWVGHGRLVTEALNNAIEEAAREIAVQGEWLRLAREALG